MQSIDNPFPISSLLSLLSLVVFSSPWGHVQLHDSWRCSPSFEGAGHCIRKVTSASPTVNCELWPFSCMDKKGWVDPLLLTPNIAICLIWGKGYAGDQFLYKILNLFCIHSMLILLIIIAFMAGCLCPMPHPSCIAYFHMHGQGWPAMPNVTATCDNSNLTAL